jgi:hypothetical protein
MSKMNLKGRGEKYGIMSTNVYRAIVGRFSVTTLFIEDDRQISNKIG